MSALVKIYQWVILSLLLSGLWGCNSLGLSPLGISVSQIRNIRTNRDANATVYLKGRVANVAPFLGTGAYEIQDGSGSIWVITNQTLPRQGDEVLIQGKVQYKSIPLGSKDLGEIYLQEEKQLERKPVQQR